MEIKEISNIYSALPQCGAFLKALSDKSMRHIFLKGMYASSASVFFAAVSGSEKGKGKSEKSISIIHSSLFPNLTHSSLNHIYNMKHRNSSSLNHII